jgi:hypothetical protein
MYPAVVGFRWPGVGGRRQAMVSDAADASEGYNLIEGNRAMDGDVALAAMSPIRTTPVMGEFTQSEGHGYLGCRLGDFTTGVGGNLLLLMDFESSSTQRIFTSRH